MWYKESHFILYIVCSQQHQKGRIKTMAFGKTMTKPKPTTADGTEAQQFEHQWMNTGNGIRKLRILPEVINGVLTQEQATDSTGKIIKGETVTIPETEVRWLEAWWDVMVGGQTQRRRLILDWRNKWNSPLWKHIQANYEKGSQERKALKDRFGINVLDMTPVLFDGNGRVVYPDINGVYNVPAYGSKRVETVMGDPKPLNRVRIFEGSTGDIGGKHLFQQVADLAEGLEDTSGKPRGIHEVTLILKTQGEGIKTTRGIRQSSDFAPLSDEYVFAPRYDIAEWSKPWPSEMIERLIDGEDFNDLVEEYNIKLFPELQSAAAVVEDVKPTKGKKASKQKLSDDEELFEE